jgi:hypothetical protein
MRAIWITSDHMALVRAYWYMCEHCGICSRQTEQGAAAETAPVKRGRDERRHQPTKGRVPWLWQMDCLIKGVLVYVRILLNNGRPFPFDFTLYPLLWPAPVRGQVARFPSALRVLRLFLVVSPRDRWWCVLPRRQ